MYLHVKLRIIPGIFLATHAFLFCAISIHSLDI
uniref:Uncharacterized protein n=1 Tax=Siphoviridae sp. ctgN495 TaxID=2825608 RepID=A0A8S5UCH9_9CAUD|nr:MAG TPA: hypothetical protein [Siphoviridae sp. ctgN495]